MVPKLDEALLHCLRQQLPHLTPIPLCKGRLAILYRYRAAKKQCIVSKRIKKVTDIGH